MIFGLSSSVSDKWVGEGWGLAKELICSGEAHLHPPRHPNTFPHIPVFGVGGHGQELEIFG